MGCFQPNYQHPFWYSESLVRVFHYSTIISTKKLSLYFHIPNIYLGPGFGPQRIRDLAFVCPWSSLSKYNRKLNYHGLFWLIWMSNILTRIKENFIIIYNPYGTWLVFFFLCYIQEGNCLSNHHALLAHIHPLLFANSLVAATKTWKWKEIVQRREENTPITYLVCQKLDHRVTSKPTCYCKLQFSIKWSCCHSNFMFSARAHK